MIQVLKSTENLIPCGGTSRSTVSNHLLVGQAYSKQQLVAQTAAVSQNDRIEDLSWHQLRSLASMYFLIQALRTNRYSLKAYGPQTTYLAHGTFQFLTNPFTQVDSKHPPQILSNLEIPFNHHPTSLISSNLWFQTTYPRKQPMYH